MRRWMQTAPLKRAYTVSTFGYTLPLLIFAIAIVLIVHSTAVAPTNELVTQAEAAQKKAASSPLEALHLAEAALAAEPKHPGALEASLDAHRAIRL